MADDTVEEARQTVLHEALDYVDSRETFQRKVDALIAAVRAEQTATHITWDEAGNRIATTRPLVRENPTCRRCSGNIAPTPRCLCDTPLPR